MIPRSGVYFMPDIKVISFIRYGTTHSLHHRLLNEYRRKCEKHLRYIEARRAREQVSLLAEGELLR
jgi:hypothetical protein